MRPPGRTTRASSAKNGVEVDEVAQGEPARDAVDRRRRAPAGAGRRPATSGAVGAGRGEHAERQVDADRPQPGGGQLAAEVAGAAGQVEHGGAAGQAEVAHRAPPPADVHAERHDPVHEVVAGRDGVEHRPHGPHLLLALGQVRRRCRARAVNATPGAGRGSRGAPPRTPRAAPVGSSDRSRRSSRGAGRAPVRPCPRPWPG